jgi:hypothetical protein
VDDVDLTAPDDIFVVVVPRLDVGPQPPELEPELARRERLVIDLPDREVRIASTRSSTFGAGGAPIDPEHESRDPQHGDDPYLHAETIPQVRGRARRRCRLRGRIRT